MIKATEIQVVPISEIRLNPKNRNSHPEEQIERLSKIIEYQGFRNPLIISNRTGLVVAGHGRYQAAQKIGLKEVPVMRQDFDSEEQEYAAQVSDNAIAYWSDLDLSGINTDLPDLGPDFDIDLLGIKNFALEPAEKDLGDPDAVPEVPAEPTTKRGDVYRLGKHRLMCGDSTNISDVVRLMDGDLADLVFTDPPYGVNYDGGHAEPGKRREKLANDDSTKIYDDSVPMMSSFSKDNAALYIWFAATKSLQVLQVLQDNNYEIRSWLIWNKNMAQFGAIGAQYKQKHEPCLYCFKKGNTPYWDGPTNEVSVWDANRASKNEFHPTQKPTELSERAIKNSSPRGGIILDLFGGSGSTMIGAESCGRIARVMEMSPAYCDVIVKRWEVYTGRKAELITPPTSLEINQNQTKRESGADTSRTSA